jgi:hypothetical protein
LAEAVDSRHSANMQALAVCPWGTGPLAIDLAITKGEVATVPKYDEMLAHEDKLSSNNTRPETSVIRTDRRVAAFPPPSYHEW